MVIYQAYCGTAIMFKSRIVELQFGLALPLPPSKVASTGFVGVLIHSFAA
jgi:hypothetical protein